MFVQAILAREVLHQMCVKTCHHRIRIWVRIGQIVFNGSNCRTPNQNLRHGNNTSTSGDNGYAQKHALITTHHLITMRNHRSEDVYIYYVYVYIYIYIYTYIYNYEASIIICNVQIQTY